MAAGLPVVATSVGGIPDVVTQGLHGRLVPPGDVPALTEAIRLIATNPSMGVRMGEAGRAAVIQQHRSDVVVGRLEELYRSLGLSRAA
jgi:glycosyltransferase involved in cell wall biosynthesis